MPIGKGKYDDECTAARESAEARATLLIVFDGKRGSGFSMQSEGGPIPLQMVCDTLESVARKIKQDAGL